MPNVIVAHQTTVMAQKEITFGVYALPTIAPGFSAFTVDWKYTNIQRPNGKKRPGQSPFPGGQFDVAGNFDPNPDPDTLMPFIAGAMGAQTAPTAAPYFTSALTGATVAGAGTVIAVTAGTGSRFLVGDSVIVGAGTANVETVVVTANAANSFTATTTKTHALADTAQALSTTAFVSTASFGTNLPSYTLEYQRGFDTWDFLGCTFNSMKLSTAPGQLLTCSIGVVGQTAQLQASPATPAYSTQDPLAFEATLPATALPALQGVLFNGAALPAGTILKKWDVNLANGVETTLRGVGSNLVQGFPVGQRKATISATFSFADASVYKAALGSPTATGPQSLRAPVALQIPIASTSFADATTGRKVPYSITVVTPNLYPTSSPVPGKQYGSLEQTFTGDAAETAGQGNDLTIILVSATASAY